MRLFARHSGRCGSLIPFLRFNHGLVGQSGAPEISKLTVVLSDKLSKQDEDSTIDTSSAPLSSPKTGRKRIEQPKATLPPSLQYVRDLMDHYKDHVVLTQMGSFYELYFEHASQYGPQLNLSLTEKSYFCGKVPFAGFPVHQLSRHLKILVNTHGYSVTIAEQFKRESAADNDVNKFYRRVTRIVTPGTFIDEAFENLQENTYLLNIEFPENCVDRIADPNLKTGLCWCDVSTGEIFVQQVLLKDLVSSITRIQPKEILLDDSLFSYNLESGSWYPELVELKKYFLKYQKLPTRHRTMDSFYNLFAATEREEDLKLLTIQLGNFGQKEIAALRNILIYVSEHMPDLPMNFQIPQRQLTGSIMQIDSRTAAALELHRTVRDNRKRGTLLSTIRRTVSPAGTRLLTQWLSGPSLDLKEIQDRQSMVQFLRNNSEVRENVIEMLKTVHDIPRILQKFSFGRGEALELMQLARSIQTAVKLRTYLQEQVTSSSKKTRNIVSSLAERIAFQDALTNEVIENLNERNLAETQKQQEEQGDKAGEIEENPESNISILSGSEIWVVNPTYSDTLRGYHEHYQTLLNTRETLQQDYHTLLVDTLGAKSVTLKQKQTGEYALHVLGTAGNLKRINDYIKDGEKFQESPLHILQQSTQTRWLSHKRWSELGYQLELAVLRIKSEEERIINKFKTAFLKKSNEIRAISDVLAHLDVLSSFAVLAQEKNLTRPKVDRSHKLEIIGGRHIMVEDGIMNRSLEKFTENNCKLDGGKLWVITGPNMGGKSTFLRQNAIIVLLAQIGSFVPCSSAHIGLVDKIFSRVGSADDLYNEMSTFMVEMIETSFILQGATKRSLAILDEIGRGTSGKEGVSIAYATLNHLAEENGCRALFATHFGPEIREIMTSYDNSALAEKACFFKSGVIDISETDFCYDYKLRPGICEKSDALKVARTAGFPEKAFNVAKALLS
ncbi:hypothetical protein HG536_0D03090 [Torulaspora globosa]|uniref:DNA mismatch repair proteins mutS family domain-containing protein n=1 Tax=Torulaspora globosa TaxID=48254 RepID=A0A7G3ZH01_9SACH|nr:uncharacterized protein HG536_0D03090 [Torulaspora globosa]QLL32787.1 hypothetical protein HG536_0D03090 [Torulaspora globosa]